MHYLEEKTQIDHQISIRSVLSLLREVLDDLLGDDVRCCFLLS